MYLALFSSVFITGNETYNQNNENSAKDLKRITIEKPLFLWIQTVQTKECTVLWKILQFLSIIKEF